MTTILENIGDIEGLNFILHDTQTRCFPDDIEIIGYVSNASADTETSVTHSLGRVPSDIIVTYQDKAGTLYDSGTAWTASTLYFKCDVAEVTYRLLVF